MAIEAIHVVGRGHRKNGAYKAIVTEVRMASQGPYGRKNENR